MWAPGVVQGGAADAVGGAGGDQVLEGMDDGPVGTGSRFGGDVVAGGGAQGEHGQGGGGLRKMAMTGLLLNVDVARVEGDEGAPGAVGVLVGEQPFGGGGAGRLAAGGGSLRGEVACGRGAGDRRRGRGDRGRRGGATARAGQDQKQGGEEPADHGVDSVSGSGSEVASSWSTSVVSTSTFSSTSTSVFAFVFVFVFVFYVDVRVRVRFGFGVGRVGDQDVADGEAREDEDFVVGGGAQKDGALLGRVGVGGDEDVEAAVVVAEHEAAGGNRAVVGVKGFPGAENNSGAGEQGRRRLGEGDFDVEAGGLAVGFALDVDALDAGGGGQAAEFGDVGGERRPAGGERKLVGRETEDGVAGGGVEDAGEVLVGFDRVAGVQIEGGEQAVGPGGEGQGVGVGFEFIDFALGFIEGPLGFGDGAFGGGGFDGGHGPDFGEAAGGGAGGHLEFPVAAGQQQFDLLAGAVGVDGVAGAIEFEAAAGPVEDDVLGLAFEVGGLVEGFELGEFFGLVGQACVGFLAVEVFFGVAVGPGDVAPPGQ